MQRPVVIVNPISSGSELASTFKARHVPAVAVVNKHRDRMGFNMEVKASDFIDVVPIQDKLEDILRKHNPLAIIPGTESAVPLAEKLTEALTPDMSNEPSKSLSRVHKAHMQKALVDAGVPAIETLDAKSEAEVERWLEEKNLLHTPLILKPPISAGSDKVFHIPAGRDWKKAFHRIISELSRLTQEKSETAVVQEEAIGTEYAVGTVSAHGKHYMSHLIKYNKTSADGRKTLFDHVEFMDFDRELHGELLEYTKKVLDALGIRWGAAHNEVMLTNKGPRLIETGARMLGGPTVGFSREATGCSQADRLAEVYIDGDVQSKEYTFKKTVVPVFLHSPIEGVVSNTEALDDVSKLPSLFENHIYFKNGSKVPKTVDYLTSIGIIALSGDREQIFKDYQKIREMESRLHFS